MQLVSVRQVLKIGAAAQLESESVRQVLKIDAAAQLESESVRQVLKIGPEEHFGL